MSLGEPIAVVGLRGMFAQAPDAATFWNNCLAALDASSDPPEGRWALDPASVIGPEGGPDRVPHARGYYLPPFASPSAVAHLDPIFGLGLVLAEGAVQGVKPVDPARAGVSLGNIVLPTVGASRWSLKVLGERFGLDASAAEQIHPWDRDPAGRVAGVVADALGISGPTFNLDAACASSLYAIGLAVESLRQGDADLMFAGGLCRPDTLYTQMGFAQLRALSSTGYCRPFDRDAAGLMVGEGGAVFALKRLSDAERDGDSIRAIIADVGLSNDRAGNLLAPDPEGQSRAMRDAYRRAGWNPKSVGYIECHATGTLLGDATEAKSYRRLWADDGGEGSCVLSSAKGAIGHLLTGAGAAGLCKVLSAIESRTLPPTAGFESAAPGLELGRDFRVLRQPEEWKRRGDQPLRAAVSAFGFGGINAHLLVEEYRLGSRGASASVPAGVPREPLAVVGMAAQVGELRDPERLKLWLLGVTAEPPAGEIDHVEFPLTRFRIPPAEVRELLPQQLLALRVAAEAWDDASAGTPSALAESSGVYLGVALDPNTTNTALRWEAIGQGVDPSSAGMDEPCAPLSPDRTMGGLASVAASRVARALKLGGPAYVVQSGDSSGVTALRAAILDLRSGRVSQAIVGAVDFASDPRAVAATDGKESGDAAVALVLKPLSRAEADGDQVLALIGGDSDGAEHVPVLAGSFGAASDLLGVYRGVLALSERMMPAGPSPVPWHRRDPETPLRAVVSGVALEQAPGDFRPRSVVARGLEEGVFALAAGDVPGLIDEIDRLATSLVSDRDAVPMAATRFGLDPRPAGAVRFACVASDTDELRGLLAEARDSLASRPDLAIGWSQGDAFYSPHPLAASGELALVYPGSGNQFAGMGGDLMAAFPGVLDAQAVGNTTLRGQYAFDEVHRPDISGVSPRDLIFAQVALGTFTTDLLEAFGLRPSAALGYSLGESAALFGLKFWRTRDEMFRRIHDSTLFTDDLSGEGRAARAAWSLPPGGAVDYVAAVVPTSAERVRQHLAAFPKAYLLIVNSADESVIGGQRGDVLGLAQALVVTPLLVPGVTIAHCDAAAPVEGPYRELHTLPITPRPGCRVYSGARGEPYEVTSDSAADSITAAVLDTIDFRRVVERAYADGVRMFVEVGPGASCTRIIGDILGDRPHLARSVCAARQDNRGNLLRTLAALFAEGVDIDWTPLAEANPVPGRPADATIQVPAGAMRKVPMLARRASEAFVPASLARRATISLAAHYADSLSATAGAHHQYLALAQGRHDLLARLFAQQSLLLHDRPAVASPEVFMDYDACLRFATGRVGDVLGEAYAEIDNFPTRVRLPDEPYQLVDNILCVEAEALSLTRGRVVTDHAVTAERWYLDAGRMPVCVAVEAGQADLFLSGYLGIDLRTRGLAVYRLLDAVVEFHRPLPSTGSRVEYDIHIDEFFRQGDTWLFRFRFESTCDGEPLLTMRDGCAGFFTAEALAGGKGVIHTKLDRMPRPGLKAPGVREYVPLVAESYGPQQVEALRRGDLAAAFGPAFADLPLAEPCRLPSGLLKLVDRVTGVEPGAGKYGLGVIRAEMDISPDDWFLTCHFVDDMVMPGTLMYECCLHTLRIMLMRMGWVGEHGEVHFGPVPGVASRLKCRGQVIESTRVVTYEITLKELGFRPEPYALADALMYADGKPVVEILDMSVMLEGSSLEALEGLWKPRATSPPPPPLRSGEGEPDAFRPPPSASERGRGGEVSSPAYTREQILAYAVGNPSEGFGDPYKIFDAGRVLARLPGPPFLFVDRVVRVTGEPFVLKAGAECYAEYDVPPDAWYFAAERTGVMPYSVLLEAALQPCGWLAAYCGSALTQPMDVSFRNLGGKAIKHRDVTPETGTLTMRAKLTAVSSSAGMIIQHYEMEVASKDGPVYTGTTYFGFFSKSALETQVGITTITLEGAPADSEPDTIPQDAPFADTMLRMADRVEWYAPSGGPAGLGAASAVIDVDPSAWFFQAHFYQDPVWPGSLGLEGFLQLLKYVVWRDQGCPEKVRWRVPTDLSAHEWLYRGQVLPMNSCVRVQLRISGWIRESRTVTADGTLSVDGRVIYQMNGFSLGW